MFTDTQPSMEKTFAQPMKMDHTMLQSLLKMQEKKNSAPGPNVNLPAGVDKSFVSQSNTLTQCGDLLMEYLRNAEIGNTQRNLEVGAAPFGLNESFGLHLQPPASTASFSRSSSFGRRGGQQPQYSTSLPTEQLSFLKEMFSTQIDSGMNSFANSSAAEVTNLDMNAFNPRPLEGMVPSPRNLEVSDIFSRELASKTSSESVATLFSEQTQASIPDRRNSNDAFTANGFVGPWSASSASLLGDMFLTSQDEQQNKKNKKKPKGKPKRPLSAYNLFFKEERTRILDEIPDDKAAFMPTEPGRRRRSNRKKKPHGKIDFQSLAKLIGKRWQALSEAELSVYKQKAALDMQRYKREMEIFAAKQEKITEDIEDANISMNSSTQTSLSQFAFPSQLSQS